MIKKRLGLLWVALICLTGCWTDHFEMGPRLGDQELVEFKQFGTPEAQWRWLTGRDVFAPGDLKSPLMGLLSRDQRIELYLELNPKLPESQVKRLKSGVFERKDSSEHIRVLFGPPTEADITGDLETWFYPHYEFHFVKSVLIDWARY